MGMVMLVLGEESAEKVCYECKEPLEPISDDDWWRWLQAVYRSRRGHRYCHNCYKRWLPEEER